MRLPLHQSELQMRKSAFLKIAKSVARPLSIEIVGPGITYDSSLKVADIATA